MVSIDFPSIEEITMEGNGDQLFGYQHSSKYHLVLQEKETNIGLEQLESEKMTKL